MDAFHWDNYAIIYEDEDSLYKLQDLIKGIAPPKRQALLRQMPPSLDCRYACKSYIPVRNEHVKLMRLRIGIDPFSGKYYAKLR